LPQFFELLSFPYAREQLLTDYSKNSRPAFLDQIGKLLNDDSVGQV